VLEGRGAIGYDHSYDTQKFYLGYGLDEKYVKGFVEGCLERLGEDDKEEELFLRDLWEEGEGKLVLEILKEECEVVAGRPEDYFPGF
jgi:hypothetical protein